MLTQLAEWTRLGFIARTNAGSYALDPPPPPAPPPSDRRSRRREERGTVEPRQPSADEQPRPATDIVHTHRVPGSDTPTPAASWT